MKNDLKQKLLVIVGPTASGKSALAVTLAKRFGGEVISADSRQVYRGLNLGSGKITKREMQGVPHHLLDIANPAKAGVGGFSVSQFQKLGKQEINKITAREKLPIICGGTGYYIRSLTDNLVLPEVKPNLKLRKKLEKKTVIELSEILKKLDERRWQEIDRQNPRRLIRAIEIATELGRVPAFHLEASLPSGSEASKLRILTIGLKLDPAILKKRIRQRLVKRLRAGMLSEVRGLHQSGVSWRRLESFGLEYKWLASFLQNKISRVEMTVGLEKDINHYAKRQMTWFKRDRSIRWLEKPAGASKIVRTWLNT